MTVTVSKPAFNLRETLNSLKQKLGAKGSGLLRANNLDEVYSVLGTSKNVLINGSMDIWQRGTSWSNNENDNYHADRWHVQRYAANGMQMSRQDPGTSIPFNYCFRLGRVSGNTDVTSYYINQPVEGINSKRLAGKYATFSFWIRAGATFTPGSYFKCGIAYHTNSSYPADGMYYQNFRSASSSSVQVVDTTLIGKVTTNWQRIEVTGYIPNGVIQVGVYIGATGTGTASGSTDYFEVTGLQLEEGVNATPFEFRSYGQELALCQRYFCKSFAPDTTPAHGLNPGYKGSVTIYDGINGWGTWAAFPVIMRANPSMTVYKADTGSTNGRFGIYVAGWQTSNSTNMFPQNGVGFYPEVAYSGLNSNSSYLTTGNWTASAEL